MSCIRASKPRSTISNACCCRCLLACTIGNWSSRGAYTLPLTSSHSQTCTHTNRHSDTPTHMNPYLHVEWFNGKLHVFLGQTISSVRAHQWAHILATDDISHLTIDTAEVFVYRVRERAHRVDFRFVHENTRPSRATNSNGLQRNCLVIVVASLPMHIFTDVPIKFLFVRFATKKKNPNQQQ